MKSKVQSETLVMTPNLTLLLVKINMGDHKRCRP